MGAMRIAADCRHGVYCRAPPSQRPAAVRPSRRRSSAPRSSGACLRPDDPLASGSSLTGWQTAFDRREWNQDDAAWVAEQTSRQARPEPLPWLPHSDASEPCLSHEPTHPSRLSRGTTTALARRVSMPRSQPAHRSRGCVACHHPDRWVLGIWQPDRAHYPIRISLQVCIRHPTCDLRVLFRMHSRTGRFWLRPVPASEDVSAAVPSVTAAKLLRAVPSV